jgi:hypothetical protein
MILAHPARAYDACIYGFTVHFNIQDLSNHVLYTQSFLIHIYSRKKERADRIKIIPARLGVGVSPGRLSLIKRLRAEAPRLPWKRKTSCRRAERLPTPATAHPKKRKKAVDSVLKNP